MWCAGIEVLVLGCWTWGVGFWLRGLGFQFRGLGFGVGFGARRFGEWNLRLICFGGGGVGGWVDLALHGAAFTVGGHAEAVPGVGVVDRGCDFVGRVVSETGVAFVVWEQGAGVWGAGCRVLSWEQGAGFCGR